MSHAFEGMIISLLGLVIVIVAPWPVYVFGLGVSIVGLFIAFVPEEGR